MAVGGYGPAHSTVLWEDALNLKPAIVIEALYRGNDFYDSFRLVYDLEQLPELRAQDEETTQQVQRSPSPSSSAF